MKYILDSNVFDYILDNNIEIEQIKNKGDYFTSNVQISELINIPNEDRRNSLLEIYYKIDQVKLDSESGVWIDDLMWDDEETWHDEPPSDFIEIQDGKLKDSKDALIGAVAKKGGIVLVSNDKKFLSKCEKFGIEYITPEEFFEN